MFIKQFNIKQVALTIVYYAWNNEIMKIHKVFAKIW
jgi:hypothetical protein